MNKKSVIGFIVFACVAIGYFSYLAFAPKKEYSQENIFLSSTAKIESLGNDFNEQEMIIYNDKNFKFVDLPEETQKKIRNEQMIAHMKINQILKDYIIRYHIAKMDNKGKNIDTRNLPKIDPLISTGTDKRKIEEIYQTNKHFFPKNHDPEQVKTDLTVKIVSQKMAELYSSHLSEIYYKEKLSLPSFPQVPEQWFQTKVTQSFGNEKAPHHLVWVGSYNDVNSSLIKEDIGLLVKKYSLKNLKISFIPYSVGLWDLAQNLNLIAICVKEELGLDAFWKYHTTSLDYGKDLVNASPKDIERALSFAQKIMKILGYKQEDRQSILSCAENDQRQNPLFLDLLRAKSALAFLPENKVPYFFLNGRYLDLAETRVFKSVDQKLQMLKVKK